MVIYFAVFPPVFYLYTHHFVPKVTENQFLQGGYLLALFFSVFVLLFKGFFSIIFLSVFMAAGVFASVYLKPKNKI